MRCPKCGHDNDPDAVFCEKCGTNLKEESDGFSKTTKIILIFLSDSNAFAAKNIE